MSKPPSTFCPHFNDSRCRSCSCIEEDHAEQLRRKERLALKALEDFLPFDLDAATPSTRTGFRNRAKMVVTGTVERPVIGLLGQEELDAGREILDCPIHHPAINAVLGSLPEIIRDHGLAPYQIRARTGELKGLIVYHSPLSNEMYLRFVLRSRVGVPRIDKMVPALQGLFPALVCISANIQPVPHAILEGPEELFLTKRDFIWHQLGELRLKLTPQAFVQTSFEVSLDLYQTAARWISEARPDRMLELFCGQGTFSFFARRSASAILGVELNESATRMAAETARELGLKHLEFRNADAGTVGEEIRAFRPDLILANPPRRGLGDSLGLILENRPRHFLYSSCSLDTLAKDLLQFHAAYSARRVRLFDMFPHTEHFETLAWLERR